MDMILKFRSLKEQVSACAKDSDRYEITRPETGDVKFSFYIQNNQLNAFIGDILELWIVVGGKKRYGQAEIIGMQVCEDETQVVCKLFEQDFVEEGD